MKEVKEIIIKRTDAREIINDVRHFYRENFYFNLRSGKTHRMANKEFASLCEKYIPQRKETK